MHKLKPTIVMMGMHEVEHDIPVIETCVKKETNLELVPVMMEKLNLMCQLAYKELREELEKL